MGEQVSERDELARVLMRVEFPYAEDLARHDLARADAALAWFAEHRGPHVASTVEELAAHDAQVKAEAWDEAVEAAARHGSRWFANPYRAVETEATR